MQHLSPKMAAATATSLRANADVQREADDLESTPAGVVRVRDATLQALIALLDQVAGPPRA